MPYANIFKRIEYEKRYRQKNREKLLQRSRNHYLKNPDAYKKRARLQRLKDAKGKKEYDRLYYQRNREKLKKRANAYYQKNAEKVRLNVLKYASQHKESIKERQKTYYLRNKPKLNEQMRQYRWKNRPKLLAAQMEYRRKNRAKLNDDQKRYYEKYPEAHLARLSRGRLNKILGGQKPKGITVFQLFGCSLPTLRRHMEKQFKKGMTWENRGRVWHVDHIVPIAHFEDKVAANHFSNLRPLFVKHNLQKGARVAGFFVFRGKRLTEYTP